MGVKHMEIPDNPKNLPFTLSDPVERASQQQLTVKMQRQDAQGLEDEREAGCACK